jgi:aryl-alcohol dehydrogenase-like predicted oxidoreductase
MEQRNNLPNTDLCLSRLAFGTASLHHLISSHSRRELLAAAVSQGITHFDTAPIYGFGLSERELGEVLAAEPSLTVASKVGLYPPTNEVATWSGVIGRKAIGKLYPPLSKVNIDFSVRTAEASLGSSLRRLRRERLDILFLHEPNIDLIETEEWHKWLCKERDRGRLRAFGIAGAITHIEPFLSVTSPLAQVIQTADSIERREADRLLHAQRPLQITYGYLASAIRSGSHLEPREVLIRALQRNQTGTILVSTRYKQHLSDYSSILKLDRK